MRTSRMQVRADHQHEPDDLNSDACQDEGDARRARGEHGHCGENKSPTGEQKEKPEKPQEHPRRARWAACAFLHG